MKKILIIIAIGVVGLASLAAQQGGAARYTPAAGAKDKKAVLFNWAWYMGMLRGPQEIEAIVALEYKATGTVQYNGQNCAASTYRVSTNYPNSGQRVQYTCKLPNGQDVKNVEVVSGTYAWDEDIPGAELVAGKGHATPKPALLRERLIRLWAGPQGALKAANAGGDKTTVAEVNGKMTVTYPIPGVPGAMATATLDAKNMPERIEVKDGATTTEFTYGNYQDWNNPLNKIDAFYAGKIVEKKNGAVVRDLTTVETETANLYVVMPVPASVKKASTPQTQ
jgi:putative hemolysin